MDSHPSHSMPLVTTTRLIRAAPSRHATKCPECGKTLLQKTLQRHIETHHSKHAAFRCEHCSKTFHRKDHLLRHLREKHDDASETVGCVYCGKQVRQRYLLEHWKGRKCIDAQNSKLKVSKDVDTESVLDPLVICASLLCHVVQAQCYTYDGFDFVMEAPGLVARTLLCEIWRLRNLAIRLTRDVFLKNLDPASPRRENIAVYAQVDILGNVDQLLFGEYSEQANVHFLLMCEANWCFTHQHEFLPLYEEATEHSWKKVLKEDFRERDRKYLCDCLRDLCEDVAPRRETSGESLVRSPSLRLSNTAIS